MGFQNWPNWFKGFMLSLILAILVIPIGFFLLSLSGNNEAAGYGAIFLIIFWLVGFIPSLLIFSFVGYLIDKKKYKNQPIIQDDKKWEGILSLILGILCILISFIFYASIPLALLTMIISSSQRKHNPTKVAKVGFILGIIGIILSIIILILLFIFQFLIQSGNFFSFNVG